MVIGIVSTQAGDVPVVSTRLGSADRWGAIKFRLGINRNNYKVEPGLYAVGTPGADSPVFVTANCKLTFDHLRSDLAGIDGWILVLDTKGVNVWCAAGKSTFGTQELVNQLEKTVIALVVSHRKLVLPQLGAPGIAAHEVKKRSGFNVVYGPVCSADINRFLAAGMKTTPEMRAVPFNLGDRAVLIPIELMQWGKYVLLAALVMFFLTGLSRSGYTFPGIGGLMQAGMLVGVYLAGGIFVPLLRPWIPARAFSITGMLIGLLFMVVILATGIERFEGTDGAVNAASWLLIAPAVSAFMALNFTGATTFTSLSGVKKEMRFAIPVISIAGALGIIMWLTALFL